MALVREVSGGYPRPRKVREGEIDADALPRQIGIPVMTPETIRQLCIQRELFADPLLNEKLFLNHKGFRHIAGLELYSNVKALYLDNNGITEIQGLDRMEKLISLWLQDNSISRISNLDRNLCLRQLNLSGNSITRIDNLKHLVQLEQLNLAKNAVERMEDLQEIQELPLLSNFDISQNCIDETEGVVEFFAGLPSLKLLRVNGNPGIGNISHYRKRMVNAMPKLNYLDDRPVFEVEKRSCAAWATGGNEAMHEAKRNFNKAREDECRVEADRKQLLTDRRNRTIARLDREEREREERAAKLLESATKQDSELGAMNAVQKGDEKAVDDYEKNWEKKLSLYGKEGLQAQEEQQQQVEGKGSAAAAMQAIRKAQENAAKQSSGEPRGGEIRPNQEGPIREAAVSHVLDAQEPPRIKGRVTNVSDFRVPDQGLQMGSTQNQEDVLERLSIREQSVWSTPWNVGNKQPKSNTPEVAGAGNDDVIPDVWKRNSARSGAEESEIMERNMRSSMAAKEAAKKEKESQSKPLVKTAAESVTELNDLD